MAEQKSNLKPRIRALVSQNMHISLCGKSSRATMHGLGRVALTLTLFMFVGSSTVLSQRAASVSGNWSNTTTWGGAAVPTSADAVTVNSSITVTVDIAANCASLTFAAVNASSLVTISGTNSLTVTGLVSMPRPATGQTCTIAVGAGTLSCGSLTMSATTGTRTDIISVSTGTLTVAGPITTGTTACQFTFTGAGTMNVGGSFSSTPTLTTFTGSTVNYAAAGAQTVRATTYSNLTLSGSGAKTTTGATVNGVLSMEGTATASAAPTYGAAFTLQYNTATARTAGVEWRTPFTGSGGVIVDNTGTITMNSAEVLNASVPLTIKTGATLVTGNFQLTLGGNFVNNGTFNAGSSAIVIASTMAAQSIAGFTTTGTVSMTKTAGTATFTGNVNGGTFILNGLGGTLDLGAGLTHTFTGAWTRSNGTLLGNSSTLTIGGTTTNTAGTFTAATSTVIYNGAAQIISNVNYFNLTLSGSGMKTLGAATTTIGGNLTMNGTASATTAANLAITGNLTLVDGSSAQLTAGAAINISGNVNVGAGTTFIGGSFIHTVGSNWTKSGTFTATGSTIDFNGAGAGNIGTSNFNNIIFSGAGTKSATGALTISGNVTISNNFTAGSFTHTVDGNWTNNGAFVEGSSVVQLIGLNAIAIGGTAVSTFNILTINNPATPTAVTLNNSINVATLNMTQGSMSTGSNSVTITTTRTGNGIIIGTITHAHPFVAGTAYAFEGPDNLITFASGGSLPTSMTVVVTLSAPNGNGYMDPINRYYTLSQTGGSGYTYAHRLHYLTSELNSQSAATLKLWRQVGSGPSWIRLGATASDGSSWVESSGADTVGSWSLSSRTVPNVSINLAANILDPPPGSTVIYTATYSNTGDGVASNMVLTLPVPPNTNYVAQSVTINGVGQTDNAGTVTVSSGVITVDLGIIAAGASGTITYVVSVN